jgi:hypothetical protein
MRDRRSESSFTPLPRSGTKRAAVMAVLAAIGALGGSGAAQAQQGKLGAYTGTIKLSGTEVSPKVVYVAVAKVVLPVTERSASSVTAEFLAGEAPNATVQIVQWDSSYTEKSPDSGGQYNSWSCTLAAPVEIPMTTTGVLNVDLKKKTHSMSVTLLSTKDVAFNCKHSRSGAYKKTAGIALTFGTGAPGAQGETQLPFTDPARLTARYTLMPNAETKGQYGPIVQEWDLRASR